MIGRTVTIALVLMVERNPLAPIATSASHLRAAGDDGGVDALEAT
jgi:hypothetical protein